VGVGWQKAFASFSVNLVSEMDASASSHQILIFPKHSDFLQNEKSEQTVISISHCVCRMPNSGMII